MKVVIHNQSELLALLSGLSVKREYPIKINYTFGKGRSMGQNALQHCIYSEVSRYLIKKGRTDCNPAWMKEMLKAKFLGWEAKVFTDIVTGSKVEKEVLRHTADLDKGEACHYTTQIIEWCASIGCIVKIPADSEYMKYMDEQNGQT